MKSKLPSSPNPSTNPFNRLGSTLRRAPIPTQLRRQVVAPDPLPEMDTSVSALIDYRDRISVATWLLVFSMGLRLLFSLPETPQLEFSAFGSPITVAITDNVVAALVLGLLAASCTQSVIAVHSAIDKRLTGVVTEVVAQTWSFWSLPTALTVIAVVLLPLTTNRVIQVLGLLIYGTLIATTFFSLYATVEVGQVGYRRGRALLNALAYGSALLLFVLVYQTRTRSLLSGSMVAITATLLTIELLRSSTANSSTLVSYGLAVGLVLGQVTWALNYWPIDELTGGLVLALIFYLMIGIAQLGLQGRLRRRVLIEYAAFALVALVLIAVVGRGFRDIRYLPRSTDTPGVEDLSRF